MLQRSAPAKIRNVVSVVRPVTPFGAGKPLAVGTEKIAPSRLGPTQAIVVRHRVFTAATSAGAAAGRSRSVDKSGYVQKFAGIHWLMVAVRVGEASSAFDEAIAFSVVALVPCGL